MRPEGSLTLVGRMLGPRGGLESQDSPERNVGLFQAALKGGCLRLWQRGQ